MQTSETLSIQKDTVFHSLKLSPVELKEGDICEREYSISQAIINLSQNSIIKVGELLDEESFSSRNSGIILDSRTTVRRIISNDGNIAILTHNAIYSTNQDITERFKDELINNYTKKNVFNKAGETFTSLEDINLK